MEIVLLFAGLLVAVALGGNNLLGFLFAFAACQFVCSAVWFVASSHLKYGR
jgi:hypothetical protein